MLYECNKLTWIGREMLRCTNGFGTVELSPPCLH